MSKHFRFRNVARRDTRVLALKEPRQYLPVYVLILAEQLLRRPYYLSSPTEDIQRQTSYGLQNLANLSPEQQARQQVFRHQVPLQDEVFTSAAMGGCPHSDAASAAAAAAAAFSASSSSSSSRCSSLHFSLLLSPLISYAYCHYPVITGTSTTTAATTTSATTTATTTATTILASAPPRPQHHPPANTATSAQQSYIHEQPRLCI